MSAFVINSYAFGGEDPDAKTYLDAVESADTQALEAGVRKAVDDFVKGCKADGIWSAIKASCILAGARTLTGALTPLVGSAPTNVGSNFVSGDYNRKNGLIATSSAKYLDANRANNADPQDSQHMAIYVHTIGSATVRVMGSGASTGDSGIIETSSQFGVRSRNNGLTLVVSSTGSAPVFFGKSRASSTTFDWRLGGTSGSSSVTSQTSSSGTIEVFRAAAGHATNWRLAFYSTGESLDLSLLRTRVDTLIADIGTAIP
jgi:hypothetical protein